MLAVLGGNSGLMKKEIIVIMIMITKMYYVPGAVLSLLHVLAHLIQIKTL